MLKLITAALYAAAAVAVVSVQCRSLSSPLPPPAQGGALEVRVDKPVELHGAPALHRGWTPASSQLPNTEWVQMGEAENRDGEESVWTHWLVSCFSIGMTATNRRRRTYKKALLHFIPERGHRGNTDPWVLQLSKLEAKWDELDVDLDEDEVQIVINASNPNDAAAEINWHALPAQVVPQGAVMDMTMSTIVTDALAFVRQSVYEATGVRVINVVWHPYANLAWPYNSMYITRKNDIWANGKKVNR